MGSMEPMTPWNDGSPERTAQKNWMGIAAVASGGIGILVLWPVFSPTAILLGHLGLRAFSNGQATNRGIALAGTILGYVGVALGILLLFSLYAQSA